MFNNNVINGFYNLFVEIALQLVVVGGEQSGPVQKPWQQRY